MMRKTQFPGVFPGCARFIADARDNPVGIEVWTGAEWLVLRGVKYASSSHHVRSANLAVANIVIDRVAPAIEDSPT